MDLDGCQVCVCGSHCNMSLIQSGNIRCLNVKESHQCLELYEILTNTMNQVTAGSARGQRS